MPVGVSPAGSVAFKRLETTKRREPWAFRHPGDVLPSGVVSSKSLHTRNRSELATGRHVCIRSATVRPLGEVRVLTIDKRTFLRKIHEDPSLPFRIMQRMSQRIRELNNELAKSVSGWSGPAHGAAELRLLIRSLRCSVTIAA